ncbi:MlaD family protein [Xanthomarina spongicola]|uniref:Phospholipid/cholesterol/gamma-HCH transport system substrate-binding protein n=1 Tax=Xanthomarina spongicola TaxID=570520 RepID=A0A316DPU0_9FLAO|nr:MlaD family protein [Xanthomarina spongicola]PWK19984.1 phospholipid/cholesterol/gamma-HCH transport system substrate-binding protein [Xanthomarina spongicola]
MKLSREVKTAILVILGIVFLIFGINYLKGKNLLDSSEVFYTEFDYNALTKASPVTIKGNNVGRINEIIYVIETGKTRVSFAVDNKLKFSKNSKIRLYELGIMEGNGLAIITADDDQYAQSGDFLQSEVEQGLITSLTKNFSGLSTGLDSTLKSADSLLFSLNGLVEDDSEAGLKHAIKELNQTLSSFKTLSGSFNSLIAKNQDSLTAVISNFSTISKNLAILSEDLKDVEISKTINNLDETLSSVNALLAELDKGEGSLGKLLNDDELYNNLEGASKELEELLEDVKLHPKRYFRILSKKEIPYEESEN